MDTENISKAMSDQENSGERYFEFLTKKSMSAGIFTLKTKDSDIQSPHSEDEIYYAIKGKGMMTVGAEEHEIRPGAVIFVGKNITHKFHSVEEDLSLLVIFAPARGTASPS